MTSLILSVGDELVLGQTVDTNSAWMSQQLAAAGCDIAGHATVGDDQAGIEHAIRSAVERVDFLIISGGIGPTEDDLTRQALAAVLGTPLETNAIWVEQLKEFFEKRGRTMPASNAIQAMIPRGATMVFNTCGTAAGIDATIPGQRPLRVFSTPGVPKEMKAMFARDVLPHVKSAGGGAAIVSRTLHTFGVGESSVAELLGDLMRRGRNPSVGTTVANGIVSLRINARFESADRATREVETTSAACFEKLGNLIFGVDDQTLQHVVAAQLVAKPGVTVATAESCTGGLVAKMLTDVPGSSAFIRYGWVTYANEAKTAELGVDAKLFQSVGAVSKEVAVAMACGARERACSTYAVAITGVAGPDGGTTDKPVGTVWIALASADAVDARMFTFPGDREWVRDRTAKMALTMLRFKLLGRALPF